MVLLPPQNECKNSRSYVNYLYHLPTILDNLARLTKYCTIYLHTYVGKCIIFKSYHFNIFWSLNKSVMMGFKGILLYYYFGTIFSTFAVNTNCPSWKEQYGAILCHSKNSLVLFKWTTWHYTVGQLLIIFNEYRNIDVQGFIWEINSFD